VQRDPRFVFQPRLHRGVLMGGVVVGHDVQFDGGMGGGDLLQEPQELLVVCAAADVLRRRAWCWPRR
jgi:hypothetical protein